MLGQHGKILIASQTFIKLGPAPTKADVKDAMPMLERFVVLMYDRKSNCLDANSCRRDLFVKKVRAMESLPPTFEALLRHTYRAAYQAGYVWRQSLMHQQQLPSPENWGWKRVGETYAPHWSDFAEAAVAVNCGCNPEKGCKGKCKCIKAELKCTEHCKCNGDCSVVHHHNFDFKWFSFIYDNQRKMNFRENSIEF